MTMILTDREWLRFVTFGLFGDASGEGSGAGRAQTTSTNWLIYMALVALFVATVVAYEALAWLGVFPL